MELDCMRNGKLLKERKLGKYITGKRANGLKGKLVNVGPTFLKGHLVSPLCDSGAALALPNVDTASSQRVMKKNR